MPITPKTIPSHTYEPTGDKNILRFVDRDGDWTHYWIKSKKIFVPAVNHIIRTGYPKGERFYNYLLNTNPQDAERKLRSAGEEGSRTHEAIRDLIRGEAVNLDTRYFNELTERFEPLAADEWHNLEAFSLWCEMYKPKVIMHEHAVWSEKYRYAGTIDFIGTIEYEGKRILILLDWKTSGGIWDDYELQIAAYRMAALEYYSQRLPLQEYDQFWTGIVRLGTRHKSGFEMKVWDAEESIANFRLFLSALDIYKKKMGSEFEPEIKQIPAEFAIHIPKFKAQKMKPQAEKQKTKHEIDKKQKVS
jgi:hypothetical protein